MLLLTKGKVGRQNNIPSGFKSPFRSSKHFERYTSPETNFLGIRSTNIPKEGRMKCKNGYRLRGQCHFRLLILSTDIG